MLMIRLMIFLTALFFDGALTAQTEREYLQLVETVSVADLRGAMLGANTHGVNPQNYWTGNMESVWQQTGSLPPELKAKAELAYLRLLRDVSSGIVDPALMGPDVRMTRKKFPSAQELESMLAQAGNNPTLLLERMSPQSPQYLALRESLKKLDEFCRQNQWPALPPVKRVLKLGSVDPILVAIKQRMSQFGYAMNNFDPVFDSKVQEAVNDIQWTLRYKPDGMISPNGRTWKYLNVPCEDRKRQVRQDMEKLRWFPQYFEDRYIFVNLAMSYFTLVDKSAERIFTMNFRTINGRFERRSPMMKDKIIYVVINPFWIVPPTIFREDKLEEIKNLWPWEVRQYFAVRNYEVWNKSFTRKIDPGSIDWYNMDPNQDAQIFIRQKPHRMNALGSLKFMMTNSYAIYLHDTNQRELFSQANRLLSSGCVRVEKPVDLAEYLLRGTIWDRAALERQMAKPGEVLENDTKVNLRNQIPVYMVFLTSQKSSDGILRFAEDTYSQAPRLIRQGVW